VARVRVVLVRPETSANVGACARVVRNTGAAGLDLVAPGDFRSVECWRTAWGAHDVLEQARVFDEMGAALAGVSLAVAFTGRRRSEGPPLEDVRDAAAAVVGLAQDAGAALVFGPETNGLTNEELALCGRAASIPADPVQPSYNLSHAVAIAGYEVLRAARRGSGARRALATHDQKQRLLALLEQGLVAVSALPRVNPAPHLAEWRALVQRIDLSPDELSLLEHLARKLTHQAP
jgi:tRNA/rRNA methyltransferase